MLLDFRVKNFKSFAEETDFSMVKAPKQTGLDYSLLKKKLGGKEISALCSSVIYGANASGKTNIIAAMDVFRSIILRGHINNSNENLTPNTSAHALELIPNNRFTKPEPVEFYIKFIEDDIIFEYCLQLDLGMFLDKEYNRKILFEQLLVNSSSAFERNENIYLGKTSSIKKYFVQNTGKKIQTAVEFAENSLNPKELFLTNGFKLIFSTKLVKTITDWFSKKFTVITSAEYLEINSPFFKPQKGSAYIDKLVNKAAKIMGINSNDLGFASEDEDSVPKLYSILTNEKSKEKVGIIADVFESYGTIRLVNIFPIIISALLNGGTLVADEFDTSLHPMVVMNIINIFHDNELNVNNAQLIFNTQNPLFLNSNLFRRDEIKFVERDSDSSLSTLYSLSDFGTAGENGVRKTDSYMNNYFVNKYGAIKNIDFTPVIEELIKNQKNAAKGEKNETQD